MKRFTLVPTFAMLVVLSAGGIARAEEQKDSDVHKERQQTIRRLSLDIAGREPTEQELRDLVGDGSADAYRKAIDRLVEQKQDILKKQKELVSKDIADALSSIDRQANLDALVLSYTDAVAKAFQGPTTYMGVGVEAPGDTLRAQLRLAQGVGLVVNFVDSNGPSKELIHQHDVLEKLDDQLLINGEQFATLVRMHKQGDSITVSLIREAKHIQVTIRLGEKETSSASPTKSELGVDLDVQFAKVNTSDLRGNLVQSIKLAPVTFTSDSLITVARTGPVTFDDGTTIAVLQRAGDQSLLAAFDRASGKLVFSGPVNNEEQWKAVPDDLQKKLVNWRGLTETQLFLKSGDDTSGIFGNIPYIKQLYQIKGDGTVITTQPAEKK